MLWKNKEINKYPDILLSDCVVEKIQLENDKILVTFSKHGFFKRSSDNDRYYRTDGSQILIENADVDNISIKEIRTHKLSEDNFFESMYDINADVFLRNINAKKWRLEIVEEFYSVGGGLFVARVKEKEDAFWCHIKLQFKNLIYLWNDLRHDFPL